MLTNIQLTDRTLDGTAIKRRLRVADCYMTLDFQQHVAYLYVDIEHYTLSGGTEIRATDFGQSGTISKRVEISDANYVSLAQGPDFGRFVQEPAPEQIQGGQVMQQFTFLRLLMAGQIIEGAKFSLDELIQSELQTNADRGNFDDNTWPTVTR
ncbi:hypothetical protein [Arsenicibacter rosenii]|uniref:Uncharacterized protein n=1 Tax=Arsenicibacter rosenii TaxID=1750698 RepID=A0A1S2VC44_9BACT|nr:hypothetical protein [Arsenicibacter rosenii]OIN55885.1 hypothetical protein BLX24_27915 [Arsenicibacter rosenii]